MSEPDNSAGRARQYHHQGQWQAAVDHYHQAQKLAPHDTSLGRDLGVCLLQAGSALQACDVLASISPNDPLWHEAALPLAVAQRASGQLTAALATLAALLQRRPHLRQARWLQATLYSMQGQHVLAIHELRALLATEPAHLEGWYNLACSLQASGDFRSAIDAHTRVARRHPAAWFNVGLCAELAGDLPLAVASYQRADNPQAHAGLLARLALAQARLCRFPAAAASRKRLLQRLLGPPLANDDQPEPFACCTLGLPPASYRDLLVRHGQLLASRIAANAPLRRKPAVAGDGRLRLGYISADFGSHAVGHLLDGLLASHDRQTVKLHLYSLSTAADMHEQALLDQADVSCRLAACEDRQAAQLIADDQLDVLIDLNGYTLGGRPAILAHRPAPRQLGWLGFVSPQWAPWLDAQIFDADLAPADSPWLQGERVLHLPGGFLPAATRAVSAASTRQQAGLPEERVLLLACHAAYKLDQAVLDDWAAILAAAPQALLCVVLPEAARAGFLAAWQTTGQPATGVLFLDNLARQEWLSRLPCFDLLLDAYVYGAGATALDALGAGLPVLTLPGQAPWTRMASSLLQQLALEKLVCSSRADYIARAVALCSDPQARTQLRQNLADITDQHPLTSPQRAARAIEDLCRQLLQDLPDAQSAANAT
jgi:protein O-GlcNAc transferase